MKSADSQLDEMVRGIGASGSRAIGAVGDLLRGMVPAPAGGSAVSGGQRDLGVRSVRVAQEGGRTARAREAEATGRDGGFLTSALDGSTEVRGAGLAARVVGADDAAAGRAAGASDEFSEMRLVDESRPGAASGGLLGDLVSERVEGVMGQERGFRPGVAGLREVPVNPFWSPERKAFERLHFGENVLGELGTQRAVSETSPGPVEMDPISLFRLRCIREAEEKFREGIIKMTQEGSSGSSFFSTSEGRVLEDQPRPPPGPPPESPPRPPPLCVEGSQPPNPPLPPVPPMPQFEQDPDGKDKGDSFCKGLVGENPSESLRTFDLPLLTEQATALEFGDWLSIVDSHMGDLSYSSSYWWGVVRKSVEGCYREWLQLGPLERLRLRPQVEAQVHLWPRTERRALSMLLQAVPDPVRCEVISARKLSTDQVLFRLFCTYQPGGASERTRSCFRLSRIAHVENR